MRVFLLWIVILLSLTLTQPVIGAKLRVRKATGTTGSGLSYSSAKLSRATNSVVVSFMNLNKVKRISYTLSYSANGIEQGAIGSLIPSGKATDSRDVYFGTCSKGVCTPHYNITNARLVVTTTLSSGGTYTKAYRIKI